MQRFWGPKPTKPLGKKRGRDGQASIMIAVMITTFITFFAFVVNTGMLINAKINLQNAADLAAYAGAGAQARLLNDISFLNYEMRRSYKKFLFRYYVLGNRGQDSFPANGASSSASLWTPATNPAVKNTGQSYGIPTVCLYFSQDDNFCHLAAQQALKMPPDFPDQIAQTLLAQFKQIELIRQNNCHIIGKNNVQILLNWLYNTDPDLTSFNSFAAGGSTALNGKALQILKAVANGLGLLPKNLILAKRIDTLNRYINAPSKTVTLKSLPTLQADVDQPKSERSILAFMSAYNTLGNNTFGNSASIVMDELMPSPLLTLHQSNVSFDTFAVGFDPNGAATGTIERDCEAKVNPVPVERVPLGVFKTKDSPPVFYAIKLSAKAQVLFNPFGADMELTAYSAAKPFGSRIGPEVTENDFIKHMNINSTFLRTGTGVKTDAKIPFLEIAGGRGWDTREFLANFDKQLAAKGGSFQKIGQAELARGYQAAMAPTPSEKGRYNMPTDGVDFDNPAGDQSTTDLMDANFNMSIWAPVTEISRGSNIRDALETDIRSMFSASTASTPAAPGGPSVATLISPLVEGLTRYSSLLQSGQGEGGDGFKVARISDAFRKLPEPGAGTRALIDLPETQMIKKNSDAFTSWSPDREPSGRIGYSVKFVSFDSLKQEGIAFQSAGGEALQHIDFLKH